MNRPASLVGALPSPAQIGRALQSLRPTRRGARRGLAIVTAVVVVLGLILVYSPIAHPRNLEVDGVTGSDKARIRDAIEQAAHGQSTFAVSEGALMKAVADYPQVAGVEIHSHPPFRLDLDVIMRPPVARVEIGGRAFVVAADGTVLNRAASADVPRIDASVDGLQIRETRITGATGVLRILGAAPESLLGLARSVRTGSSGLEVVMSRGPRLIFGNSSYAADKWAAAAAVIADGPAAKASYIDLRVPGRPAVGGLGGSRAAGYADAPPVLDDSTAAAAAAATSAATDQATPGIQAATTQAQAAPQAQASTGGAATTGTGTASTGAGTATAGTATGTQSQTQTSTGTATGVTGTAAPATAETPSSGTSTSGGASLGGAATP